MVRLLIYATAAALIFNNAFFPTFDPLAGTLAAVASLAVGFLARPLGGARVGYFGGTGGVSVVMIALALITLAAALAARETKSAWLTE